MALKGIPVRLLQVTDGGAHSAGNGKPGMVIEATPDHGLLVACGGGGTLFIDIVYVQDGFFPVDS